MRVFVTGATGFVGSAVVHELIQHGHQVLGLARSDSGAAALTAAGAEVQRGDLDDLDALRHGAATTDGVIHCAFNHDFSKFLANCAQDKLAIHTMGAVLEGTRKPILTTSGLAMLAPGRIATEEDTPPPPGPTSFPRESESSAMELAARGIRASTVRLAPSVHGDGDHGFVPALIGIARQRGVAAYVGEGQNRWTGVHRLDAAVLYRLALEKAATGARYHGAGEVGVTFKQLAEVIGRRLNIPVVSKTPEEALEHFGFLGRFAGMDMAASSEITQKTLGWQPTHEGLLADVDNERYFTS